MENRIYKHPRNKRHKVKGIPWADDKGYIRYGVVGGILDHGPMYSKEACYLESRATGRRIIVRYNEDLHPEMCAHMGQNVTISGKRYYDNSGILDSMDVERIERNEMQNVVKSDCIISRIPKEKEQVI